MSLTLASTTSLLTLTLAQQLRYNSNHSRTNEILVAKHEIHPAVRGTRPFAARDAPAARDSASRATTYARPPPSRPLLPLAPSAPPSEPSEVDPSELVRSSRVALGRRPLGSYAYHAACDQADAICRAQRRARDYPGLID